MQVGRVAVAVAAVVMEMIVIAILVGALVQLGQKGRDEPVADKGWRECRDDSFAHVQSEMQPSRRGRAGEQSLGHSGDVDAPRCLHKRNRVVQQCLERREIVHLEVRKYKAQRRHCHQRVLQQSVYEIVVGSFLICFIYFLVRKIHIY